MKKTFITLLVLFTNIIIITTFNSCGNDDSLDEVTSIPQQKVDPYYVNYEQALSEAIEFMHGDILRKGTRAGINRRVENHYEYSVTNRFVRKQTRSAVDNDTIDVRFHVINFANDGGFALVSADRRTTPIYAYSESGHLDLEDAIANTGVGDFMEVASENYKNEVINRVGLQPLTPVPTDSIAELLIITDEFGNQYHVSYGSWQTVSSVSSLVDVEWGQGYPYNYYAKFITSNPNTVVGCGPVAAGQIMSYFQHPHYIAIEGDTLSWNTMLNENSYNNICPGSMQVSRLLTEIGILSNANFGETTSTTINNVRNTICSFGYTCSEVSDFDATNIRSSLLSQHLVYARGGDLYSGNGHAWVIDGFIYQTMQTTYYSLNPPYHVVGGSERQHRRLPLLLPSERECLAERGGQDERGDGQAETRRLPP